MPYTFTCHNCSATFTDPTHKHRRYCSRACSQAATTHATRPYDLWACIDKRGPDDCWPWLGSTINGYGIARGQRKAHRAVWQETHGPIPSDLFIRHTCNNRACCNPAHLSSGTHAQNMADRASNTYYTDLHRKVTEHELRAIRHLRTHHVEARLLAQAFGLSIQDIRSITET